MNNASAGTHDLPPGTLLADCYRIERTLGRGGFGITYLALDDNLSAQVAIKEYFVPGLMRRHGDGAVSVAEGADAALVQWGLNRFLNEAKVLAKFPAHPNIVRVARLFEANGTAYIVQEYVAGQDLEEKLLVARTLPVSEVKRIALDVCAGLRECHRHNVQHLDIKPSNIRIRHDGAPVLIDFGAARQELDERAHVDAATGGASSKYVHSYFYSPREIFARTAMVDGKRFGPWTDLYSLCATLYVALTGEALPEAIERSPDDDPYKPLSQTDLAREDSAFIGAIDWGLAYSGNARPRSVDDWLAVAEGRSLRPETVFARRAPADAKSPQSYSSSPPAGLPRWALPAVGAVAAIALLFGGYQLLAPGDGLSGRSAHYVAQGGVWNPINLAELNIGQGGFQLASEESFRVRTSEGVLLATPDDPIHLGAVTSGSIDIMPLGEQPVSVEVKY